MIVTMQIIFTIALKENIDGMLNTLTRIAVIVSMRIELMLEVRTITLVKEIVIVKATTVIKTKILIVTLTNILVIIIINEIESFRTIDLRDIKHLKKRVKIKIEKTRMEKLPTENITKIVIVTLTRLKVRVTKSKPLVESTRRFAQLWVVTHGKE
uniref:Uncharacterized protein n=1 Tax=Cacopsylla melanoneura TaxID=428564 RepID=A0A8D9DZL1_9HEMI